MPEELSAPRALVTLCVMLAALMQVIDTTIVTVAEPYIQGSLSANADEISWVLTSYLVSSGILMPLTGYFTDKLGRKKYLLISIAGFVAASMLCGLAANLTEMVIFRLLQGVAGAALVPLAQATLVAIYPKEKQGYAMAIFGLAAMTGPVLGPTLGGYLTQILDWRWTFFINVPIGIAAFLGTMIWVPDTTTRSRRMDWLGFLLLALAICCMQFVLDRGNRDDWFNSHLIQILTLTAIAGGIGFLVRCRVLGGDAFVDLNIFKDRNFALSCAMFTAFMFSMYGALQLQPQLVESLLNYPVFTAGLVLAPRGISSALAMFTVGRVINRTGAKPLIFIGILLAALGTLATTRYNLDVDAWWIIWPILIQGLGIGFAFVPLSTVAFSTLPAHQISEAAGMRQLIRTIGASVGTSVATTIYTRQAQAGWNQIGAHITPFNNAVGQYLAPLHLSMPSAQGGAVLSHLLVQQANMRSMLDVFLILGLSIFCTLPMLPFIRYGARASYPSRISAK